MDGVARVGGRDGAGDVRAAAGIDGDARGGSYVREAGLRVEVNQRALRIDLGDEAAESDGGFETGNLAATWTCPVT